MSGLPLETRLATSRALLLDGGLSTELERRGASLEGALWSARPLVEDPGILVAAHRAFAAAGAEVLTTASYQTSAAGLRALGVPAEGARELFLRSVSLARLAAWESGLEPPPLIAASLGSYGATLPGAAEYRGRFGRSREQYRDFHGPRLEALLAAAPDIFAIETLPSLDEAEALTELLEELGAKAWLSFTTEDGHTTRGGDPLAEAFALADASPASVATGVNCCPPEAVAPALTLARAATDKPLLAYPNTGARYDASSRSWGPAPARDLATLAAGWLEQGARLVGGCCGIGAAELVPLAVTVAAFRERGAT